MEKNIETTNINYSTLVIGYCRHSFLHSFDTTIAFGPGRLLAKLSWPGTPGCVSLSLRQMLETISSGRFLRHPG